MASAALRPPIEKHYALYLAMLTNQDLHEVADGPMLLLSREPDQFLHLRSDTEV